jgi:threonine/homoserine efflux transporter RhtA
VILPWKGLPDFAGLSLRCWMAVLWLSIIGTTIPYLYWLHALNRTFSIASVVLSLFLQPLIGSAAGFLFLGEHFAMHQLAGGAMIIGAVAFQVVAGDRPNLKQALPRH